jgi:hypothetical protein
VKEAIGMPISPGDASYSRKICGSAREVMRYSQIYHSVLNRLENLDFNQVALLVLLIVAFGFYCLRGFGSRHNY